MADYPTAATRRSPDCGEEHPDGSHRHHALQRDLPTVAWSNPRRFWAEAAADDRLDRALDSAFSTTRVRPSTAGSPAGRLNTCYNALDRHVENGRGEQPALIYDSPVATDARRLHLPRTARRGRPVRRRARAPGRREGRPRRSSTCRWSPRRLIAMLACARLGASTRWSSAASPRTSWRPGSTTPSRRSSSRPPAGSSPGASSPTSRCSTPRSSSSKHKPDRCIILQRPQLEAELDPGRDLDWARGRSRPPQPAECVPGRGDRSALHPLHLGHDRPAQGHRPRQRRPRRRAAWSMKNIYDVEPGEVYWAASDVGWVVGHSYIVYAPLLHGCTTVLYEGKPVGTPDAGRVLARDLPSTVSHDVHRADRVPRDPPAGSRGRAHRALRPVALPQRSSWPASAATPRRCAGPSTSSACR